MVQCPARVLIEGLLSFLKVREDLFIRGLFHQGLCSLLEPDIVLKGELILLQLWLIIIFCLIPPGTLFVIVVKVYGHEGTVSRALPFLIFLCQTVTAPHLAESSHHINQLVARRL